MVADLGVGGMLRLGAGLRVALVAQERDLQLGLGLGLGLGLAWLS